MGYYKQVCDLLKANGFAYYKQGKGSHEKWKRGPVVVLVPFNCYSRHTANAIMHDAGINHRF